MMLRFSQFIVPIILLVLLLGRASSLPSSGARHRFYLPEDDYIDRYGGDEAGALNRKSRILVPSPASPLTVAPGERAFILVRLRQALTPPPGIQKKAALEGWSGYISGKRVLSFPEKSAAIRFPLRIVQVRPSDLKAIYRVTFSVHELTPKGSYDIHMKGPGLDHLIRNSLRVAEVSNRNHVILFGDGGYTDTISLFNPLWIVRPGVADGRAAGPAIFIDNEEENSALDWARRSGPLTYAFSTGSLITAVIGENNVHTMSWFKKLRKTNPSRQFLTIGKEGSDSGNAFQGDGIVRVVHVDTGGWIRYGKKSAKPTEWIGLEVSPGSEVRTHQWAGARVSVLPETGSPALPSPKDIGFVHRVQGKKLFIDISNSSRHEFEAKLEIFTIANKKGWSLHTPDTFPYPLHSAAPGRPLPLKAGSAIVLSYRIKVPAARAGEAETLNLVFKESEVSACSGGEIRFKHAASSGRSAVFSIETGNGSEVPVSVFRDFGDGRSGTGATISHRYLEDGSYEVYSAAVDDQACVHSSSENIHFGRLDRFSCSAGLIGSGI